MRRAIAVHRQGAWPEGEALGEVTLTSLDRHRRRLRLISDAGEAVLLDLPQAAALAEGDGLALEGGGYLRIRAAPEPLAEITAADAAALARLAWHLGNRHLPVEIAGAALRIRWDHVIVAMLEGLGARVRRIEAPFDPEAGAYAGGTHHHGSGDDGHPH
jgi:urease accessory protein